MPRVKILIAGQIGSTYNEDGSVKDKGVELQDVVMQVASNPDAEGYDILIESGGGSVDVGNAIAAYISSLPNVITIAGTFCASIATRIHLAVPVEKRKKIAGGRYIIHNPMLTNVTGNSAELSEMADYIKQFETDMIKMYHNATGLDKAAIEGLMAQETDLTDEQCKTFGFISEVLTVEGPKAIAFITTKPKQTTEITMSKIKEMIDQAFAGIQEKITGKKQVVATKKVTTAAKKPEPKAEVLVTDGDISIYTDMPLSEFIADNTKVVKAFSDEAMTTPVADGDYTLKDGSEIKVAGGVVTEVKEVEAEPAEADVEALEARIAELETENANMRAEFENELTAKVTELMGQIGSNYTPKAEVKKFGKTTVAAAVQKDAGKKSLKEQAKERSASYKGAAATAEGGK